jgi:hypothetical protein
MFCLSARDWIYRSGFRTVCGVFAAVLPKHLFGAFVFGGVGVFLVFCLLGAATGVRAARSVP